METEQNEPGMVRPWLLIVLAIVVLAGIGFFSWNYLQNKKTDTSIASNNSTIATPTPDTAIVVPTATPTDSTVSTVTPAPTSSWKTFTTSQDRLSFNYPSNWVVKYNTSSYSFDIANKESCLVNFDTQKIPSGCEKISIYDAISGSGTMANQANEAKLSKDSYYIQESISSGEITVNSYWSGAKNDFQAYFDNSHYHVIAYFGSDINSSDMLSVAKKILATVKIAPITQ